nr:hypothetical protein [Tanacetum cinerariifolium]
MPPRMRTQNAGRPAAESLRGGMGVRVGRGRRGRRPREGNDERVDDLNGQGNDQGMGANGGVKRVNGNVKEANGGAPDFSTIIAQQLHNLLPAMLAQVGCSYKEFLACSPKEYDGKEGVVVLTRWIEKMEYVHDISGYGIDQKVKYTTGLFMGKALTWWNSQIRTLSWEVAISMSWNDFKADHAVYTDRFHELARLVVQISGALTDEGVRNGSIKKVEKKGNMGEPNKNKNVRDDNKRTRTGNVFATIVNLVGRENTGTWPKWTTCNSYHVPGEENCPNQVFANNGGQGHGNQGNQARGRAFMLGAEEARQDPNIVTGMFTLNDHFDTTLFDSGANYSFVSTTFIPRLGIVPIELGFRYKIEIASGQLVEIDKVIKNCQLEIKGHVFDIDLIPFGHGSFDVIIGVAETTQGNPIQGFHLTKLIALGSTTTICKEKGWIDDILDQLQWSQFFSKIYLRPYLDKFVIVFIEDVLIYSKTQKEHVEHLRYVINGNGIHVDPSKIKAVKNWKAPRTLIENLKDKLCNAPILALPDGQEDFVVYCDASETRLGCVLMQRGKVIADASRQLKIHEKNYTTYDLELELFSDYDCRIHCHPSKANVVADALSRKERVKPKRVRDI